jgi:hypothetical protein
MIAMHRQSVGLNNTVIDEPSVALLTDMEDTNLERAQHQTEDGFRLRVLNLLDPYALHQGHAHRGVVPQRRTACRTHPG